jgi:hypothetical protein
MRNDDLRTGARSSYDGRSPRAQRGHRTGTGCSEGLFDPIGWDEALSLLTERLRGIRATSPRLQAPPAWQAGLAGLALATVVLSALLWLCTGLVYACARVVRVVQLSMGFTGSSHNTQEVFHRAPPGRLQRLKPAFLLLAFRLSVPLLALPGRACGRAAHPEARSTRASSSGPLRRHPAPGVSGLPRAMKRRAHEMSRQRPHTFDSPYKFQRQAGTKLPAL